jgi:hypothetical protein
VDASPLTARLDRRQFLEGSVGLIACLTSPGQALAQSFEGEAALDRFMHMSRVVTGKHILDRQVGRRLMQVLSTTPTASKLEKLMAAVERSRAQPGQDIAQLLKSEPFSDKEIEHAARELTSGWYLGVVGSEESAVFVTYTDALMWLPVIDFHNVPSFCGGIPGFWSEPPKPYPNPWM